MLKCGLQQTVVAEKVKDLVDPQQRLFGQVSLHEGFQQAPGLVHCFLQVVQVEAKVHLVEGYDGELGELELFPKQLSQLKLLLVQLIVSVENADFYHSFNHVLDDPFRVSFVVQL